jgi:hypothetical protein
MVAGSFLCLEEFGRVVWNTCVPLPFRQVAATQGTIVLCNVILHLSLRICRRSALAQFQWLYLHAVCEVGLTPDYHNSFRANLDRTIGGSKHDEVQIDPYTKLPAKPLLMQRPVVFLCLVPDYHSTCDRLTALIANTHIVHSNAFHLTQANMTSLRRCTSNAPKHFQMRFSRMPLLIVVYQVEKSERTLISISGESSSFW